MRNKRIIICGIVRDAEKALRRNIPIIDALCKEFKEYHVVVFENDSRDQTKLVLCEWMKRDKEHIHCILNDHFHMSTIPSQSDVKCNPFFSHKRIDKMATLRNQYLEYIERQGWETDYLMVIDLDVEKLFLDGIRDSFLREEPWDALFAYGYSTSPRLKRRYHDTYALWENGDEYSVQTEKHIKEYADKFAKLCKGSTLVPVYSGFGGIAIYRYETIRGLRYTVEENMDPRVEVRCEHFGLNRQIHERGYNNTFINPLMKLQYQRLSWKVVWSAMKRYLNK